jgi:hypothetical protein
MIFPLLCHSVWTLCWHTGRVPSMWFAHTRGSTLSFLLFWPFCLDYQTSNMWRVCTMHAHTPHSLLRSLFWPVEHITYIGTSHVMHAHWHACFPFSSPPRDFRMFSWLNLGVCSGHGRHNSGPPSAVHKLKLCWIRILWWVFAHFYGSQVCGCGAPQKKRKKKPFLFFLHMGVCEQFVILVHAKYLLLLLLL